MCRLRFLLISQIPTVELIHSSEDSTHFSRWMGWFLGTALTCECPSLELTASISFYFQTEILNVTRVGLWFFFFISFMSPESAPVHLSVDIFSGFAWWEMSIHIICPILIKSEGFDVAQIPSPPSMCLLLHVGRWQHLLSFMTDFMKKPLRSMDSYVSILFLCLCLWYIITCLYYLYWLSGKCAHVFG